MYAANPEDVEEEVPIPNLPDSAALQIGSHWKDKGVKGLRFLFIFGDSYSSVGYKSDFHPTDEEPIDLRSPESIWTEDGDPNWVGHLIESYNPSSLPLLVYNYAVGGHDINQCTLQVQRDFLPRATHIPDWKADNSLFVIWIGTNDVRMYNKQRNQSPQRVIGLVEEMYTKAGARNFLLIDVGPHRRDPEKPRSGVLELLDSKCAEWNTLLHTAFTSFLASHPDATGLYFSSWNLCMKIYTNPEEWGFTKDDVTKLRRKHEVGKGMWWDHIHPTSKMHEVWAEEIGRWLESEEVNPGVGVGVKAEKATESAQTTSVDTKAEVDIQK